MKSEKAKEFLRTKQPGDIAQYEMTHGSLFSGIGGFDLAAEWAGWENVFACEIDPFCQKVLKYHFPKSTLYENIRTTDFTIWRGRINVLSGGFPCQPFSTAGKRKGTEDDRYLWPEMLRAIREISPRWVVGENVLGIVNWNGGMVFEQVCADMEAEGYEVQPYVLPACGIGAPHQRQRTWFVAHRADAGNESMQKREDSIYRLENAPHSWFSQNNRRRQGGLYSKHSGSRHEGIVTDSPCNKYLPQGQSKEPEISWRENAKQPEERRKSTKQPIRCNGFLWDAPYTGSAELQRGKQYRGVEGARKIESQSGQSCRSICGKWENFPTQCPVRGRNDGIPSELDGITIPSWCRESLKAYGNSVVPLVPLQIFNAINQYEKINR